eukprot:CAMPEP_0198245184 /NCGR_PEP_ID=MMETSP1446-20131203/39635_1 /TAXON_ID=1461542 ORGANISM="Unidentified sp, Strain CCMP2111" /NCGR_SAMPLE_ID=MMETSP1446 /ASSEMBLY_ACC=CAM_ASM_001112 /LENGTH=71 /DNA_ID=CAMNT_0043929329 /DNA_START=209 /DNA_END=421 /DNA_ORIENTATION=+
MESANGGVFSVVVPSWTTGQNQGEEGVIYYNLEVRVQRGASQGDSGEASPSPSSSHGSHCRTVQRRFSDFR